MIVGAPAVVVHVHRGEVAGHDFDGVDEIAVDVRVAEIEADADLCRFEVFFDEVHERPGARQVVGNDLDGNPNAERFGEQEQLLDAAARGVAVAAPESRVRARPAEMDHQHFHRDASRDLQRALHLGHRLRARFRVRAGDRDQLPEAAAAVAS